MQLIAKRGAAIGIGLVLLAAGPGAAPMSRLSWLFPRDAAQAKAAKPAPVKPRARAKKPAVRPASPPTIAAYAAMSIAERLRIQSDLAWTADYAGLPGGEIAQPMIDAIKAFQKRHGAKETGVLTDEQRVQLASAAAAPQRAVGWQLIDDP